MQLMNDNLCNLLGRKTNQNKQPYLRCDLSLKPLRKLEYPEGLQPKNLKLAIQFGVYNLLFR